MSEFSYECNTRSGINNGFEELCIRVLSQVGFEIWTFFEELFQEYMAKFYQCV
jgi:hypothetical protein